MCSSNLSNAFTTFILVGNSYKPNDPSNIIYSNPTNNIHLTVQNLLSAASQPYSSTLTKGVHGFQKHKDRPTDYLSRFKNVSNNPRTLHFKAMKYIHLILTRSSKYVRSRTSPVFPENHRYQNS